MCIRDGSNAVRYCAGDIMISLSEEGNGKVVFYMENTVPAGTKIDTARIFDRFYTGDPSRHGESLSLIHILEQAILLQFFWLVVMVFAGKILEQRAMKRIVVQGG